MFSLTGSGYWGKGIGTTLQFNGVNSGGGSAVDGLGVGDDGELRNSYGFIGQITVTPANSKVTLAGSFGSSYLKATDGEAAFKTENIAHLRRHLLPGHQVPQGRGRGQLRLDQGQGVDRGQEQDLRADHRPDAVLLSRSQFSAPRGGLPPWWGGRRRLVPVGVHFAFPIPHVGALDGLSSVSGGLRRAGGMRPCVHISNYGQDQRRTRSRVRLRQAADRRARLQAELHRYGRPARQRDQDRPEDPPQRHPVPAHPAEAGGRGRARGRWADEPRGGTATPSASTRRSGARPRWRRSRWRRSRTTRSSLVEACKG